MKVNYNLNQIESTTPDFLSITVESRPGVTAGFGSGGQASPSLPVLDPVVI